MFDINEIKKINLCNNDVLLIKVEKNDLPRQKLEEYYESLRQAMKINFPNNKIIVYPSEISFSIISQD